MSGNGRVYDPVMGMFLSPDNFVQEPGNSQNFNRYAYCLNNPLIYSDPSGEFFWFVIGGAIIGSYIGSAIKAGEGHHGANWNPFGGKKGGRGGTDWWKGAIVGGIVGAGAGALMASVLGPSTVGYMVNGTGGSSLGWSMTSSSLISGNFNMAFTAISGGDLDETWKSGISGLISGAITGGVNYKLDPVKNSLGFWKGAGIHGTVGGTTSLIDGKIQGLKGEDLLWHTLRGAGTSALMGGISEGLQARWDGKSFLTGDYPIDKTDPCLQIFREPLPWPTLRIQLGLTVSEGGGRPFTLLALKVNESKSWTYLHWPSYARQRHLLFMHLWRN